LWRTSAHCFQVTEYFWQFDVSYSLFAFAGSNPEDHPVEIASRSAHIELKTSADATPQPEVVIRPSIDLNITWLLQHLDGKLEPLFTIDRTVKSCHTPRRNSDIDAAIAFAETFSVWSQAVQQYFNNTLFPVQTGHGLNLGGLSAGGIFVPVQPLFEGNSSERKLKDEGRPWNTTTLTDL
jgi:hypothetical protein